MFVAVSRSFARHSWRQNFTIYTDLVNYSMCSNSSTAKIIPLTRFRGTVTRVWTEPVSQIRNIELTRRFKFLNWSMHLMSSSMWFPLVYMEEPWNNLNNLYLSSLNRSRPPPLTRKSQSAHHISSHLHLPHGHFNLLRFVHLFIPGCVKYNSSKRKLFNSTAVTPGIANSAISQSSER